MFDFSLSADLDIGGNGQHETSMTKVYVSEIVNRVVDRALQICGSTGVSTDLPLASFYRNTRPFRIYDGPSEVHRTVIARTVLKDAAARATLQQEAHARAHAEESRA